MDTIAFKLNSDDEILLKNAGEKAGISRHKLAKQIVLDHLNDSQRIQMREQLTALREEVIQLRQDFATVAIALLAGQEKHSYERIEKWAMENLLCSSSASHLSLLDD